MRAVKRLRSLRFRSYVLPAILAALAGRALAPAGFMTTTAEQDGTRVVETQLCSLDQDRRGVIELPGESHERSQCDHCLSPMGIAPIALLAPSAPVRIVSLLPHALEDQVAHASLQRAQLARAPPHG
jgi:hypothetical protein